MFSLKWLIVVLVISKFSFANAEENKKTTLNELDAIVAQTESLSKFLKDSQLIDEYCSKVPEYFGGVTKSTCEKKLKEIKDLIKNVPGLEERLWETEGMGETFSVVVEIHSYGRDIDTSKFEDFLADYKEKLAKIQSDTAIDPEIQTIEDPVDRTRALILSVSKLLDDVTENLKLDFSDLTRRERAAAKDHRSKLVNHFRDHPHVRAVSAYLISEYLKLENIDDALRSGDPDTIINLFKSLNTKPQKVIGPNFSLDPIFLGTVRQMLPTHKELLHKDNEHIFPRKMMTTNRGKTTEIGTVSRTEFTARVFPRRLHSIYRTEKINECISNMCRRYLTTALRNSQIHAFEDENGHYIGFTQSVEIQSTGSKQLFGSTEASVPILKNNVTVEDADGIRRKTTLFALWFEQYWKQKPKNWNGLLVGKSNSGDNAHVLDMIRESEAYKNGIVYGNPDQFQTADPIESKLLAHTQDSHYSGNRMVYDASLKNAKSLTGLLSTEDLEAALNNGQSLFNQYRNGTDDFKFRLLVYLQSSKYLKDHRYNRFIKEIFESETDPKLSKQALENIYHRHFSSQEMTELIFKVATGNDTKARAHLLYLMTRSMRARPHYDFPHIHLEEGERHTSSKTKEWLEEYLRNNIDKLPPDVALTFAIHFSSAFQGREFLEQIATDIVEQSDFNFQNNFEDSVIRYNGNEVSIENPRFAKDLLFKILYYFTASFTGRLSSEGGGEIGPYLRLLILKHINQYDESESHRSISVFPIGLPELIAGRHKLRHPIHMEDIDAYLERYRKNRNHASSGGYSTHSYDQLGYSLSDSMASHPGMFVQFVEYGKDKRDFRFRLNYRDFFEAPLNENEEREIRYFLEKGRGESQLLSALKLFQQGDHTKKVTQVIENAIKSFEVFSNDRLFPSLTIRERPRGVEIDSDLPYYLIKKTILIRRSLEILRDNPELFSISATEVARSNSAPQFDKYSSSDKYTEFYKLRLNTALALDPTGDELVAHLGAVLNQEVEVLAPGKDRWSTTTSFEFAYQENLALLIYENFPDHPGLARILKNLNQRFESSLTLSEVLNANQSRQQEETPEEAPPAKSLFSRLASYVSSLVRTTINEMVTSTPSEPEVRKNGPLRKWIASVHAINIGQATTAMLDFIVDVAIERKKFSDGIDGKFNHHQYNNSLQAKSWILLTRARYTNPWLKRYYDLQLFEETEDGALRVRRGVEEIVKRAFIATHIRDIEKVGLVLESMHKSHQNWTLTLQLMVELIQENQDVRELYAQKSPDIFIQNYSNDDETVSLWDQLKRHMPDSRVFQNSCKQLLTNTPNL